MASLTLTDGTEDPCFLLIKRAMKSDCGLWRSQTRRTNTNEQDTYIIVYQNTNRQDNTRNYIKQISAKLRTADIFAFSLKI